MSSEPKSSLLDHDDHMRQELWLSVVRCYASEAEAEKTAKPWLDDLFPIWKALHAKSGVSPTLLHKLDNPAYRLETILVLITFLAHHILKKRIFFVSATQYYMYQAKQIYNTFKARWNANSLELQAESDSGIDMFFGSPEIFPSVLEQRPLDLVCMHGSNWFPALNQAESTFKGIVVVQDMKGEADGLSFRTPCMYGYDD